MKIHPPVLPRSLRGRLEFGNRKQINAMRDYEAEYGEYEKAVGAIKSGELKQYCVTLEYNVTRYITVTAHSTREAEVKAREVDYAPSDSDFECASAREIT